MKIGLIGQDIGYSKSKEIFESFSSDMTYEVMDIQEKNIRDAIYYMQVNKFAGFNVTKPFKHKIKEYMDCMLLDIYDVGINCVKFTNKYPGYFEVGASFDGPSFLYSLMAHKEAHEVDMSNVAILGNGGVVPSIDWTLHTYGRLHGMKRGTIFARNRGIFSGHFANPQAIFHIANFKANGFGLIINTIPYKAGLNLDFESDNDFIYFDLNYADDRLVNIARQHPKCKLALNGLEMLRLNAINSYRFMTMF